MVRCGGGLNGQLVLAASRVSYLELQWGRGWDGDPSASWAHPNSARAGGCPRRLTLAGRVPIIVLRPQFLGVYVNGGGGCLCGGEVRRAG